MFLLKQKLKKKHSLVVECFTNTQKAQDSNDVGDLMSYFEVLLTRVLMR